MLKAFLMIPTGKNMRAGDYMKMKNSCNPDVNLINKKILKIHI